MTSNRVEIALERLLAIDWNEDFDRVPSAIYLVREYLRRMALWAKTLDQPNIFTRWRAFDVGKLIAPSNRAPDSSIKALGHYFVTNRVGGLTGNVCEWFLHWSAIQQSDNLSAFDLPAPYDPLIFMFERGGTQLGYEHGWLRIGVIVHTGLNNDFEAHISQTPIVDLDNGVLDEIDVSEAGRYIYKPDK